MGEGGGVRDTPVHWLCSCPPRFFPALTAPKETAVGVYADTIQTLRKRLGAMPAKARGQWARDYADLLYNTATLCLAGVGNGDRSSLLLNAIQYASTWVRVRVTELGSFRS